jgi:hypothetical protein
MSSCVLMQLNALSYSDVSNSRLEHATLVGVTDPTGSIPQGHVFLTGLGDAIPKRVFLNVYPATEADDGIVVPVAMELPARARLFLERLNAGAVVFPQGPDDTLIPPKLDNGDLDGDLYTCVWNKKIIKYLQDNTQDDFNFGMPADDDDLLWTEFQIKVDGSFRPALVVGKINDDLYHVEVEIEVENSDERVYERKRMTKEDIYSGTSILEAVIGHRFGKKRKQAKRGVKQTEFHFKWASGVEEWVTVQTVAEDYQSPPELLVEYAQEQGLLGVSGPKDCKWLKKYFFSACLLKIKDRRQVGEEVEVLCEYDGDIEEWESLEDVKVDGKVRVPPEVIF